MSGTLAFSGIGGVCSLLSLQTRGLTFASVHDSYWTHPSSIDQMSTIIRDTFIALHSTDVLGRLLSEVTCSHPPKLPTIVTTYALVYLRF